MKIDVPWSIGFIAGAAAAGFLLKAWHLEFHALLNTVITIAAGVGGGWFAESYAKKK